MAKPPAYSPAGSAEGATECVDCVGTGRVQDPPGEVAVTWGALPGDACPACNAVGITGLLDPGSDPCR